MICPNCGNNSSEQAQFCGKCGAKLSEASRLHKSDGKDSDAQSKIKVQKDINANKVHTKKKKSKAVWVIFFIVLAGVIGGSCYYFVNKQVKLKEYENKIAKGDKYLSEMDYTQAEATFLELIEINPKDEEVYLRLAETYIVQDKYDEAIEILEQGIEQTESMDIKEKLTYTKIGKEKKIPEERRKKFQEFLKTELIPKYGVAEDEMTFTYENERVDGNKLKALQTDEGIRSVAYEDLTGDGIEEMIVVRSCKYDPGFGIYERGLLMVQVYQMEGEEIKELETGIRKMNFPIYRAWSVGDIHVFTKKADEVTYVGISYNSRRGAMEPRGVMITELYAVKDGRLECEKAVQTMETEVIDLTSSQDNLNYYETGQEGYNVIKSTEYDMSLPVEIYREYAEIYANQFADYNWNQEWYTEESYKFLSGNTGGNGFAFTDLIGDKLADSKDILSVYIEQKVQGSNWEQTYTHQDMTEWKDMLSSGEADMETNTDN